jgi:hypothetical protein
MRFIRLESGRKLKTFPNGPMPWIKARERAFALRGAADLNDTMGIFGLGATATGRLFGVSRQAVDQWLAKGVPLGRLADVGAVAQAARALYAYFRPSAFRRLSPSQFPDSVGAPFWRSPKTNRAGIRDARVRPLGIDDPHLGRRRNVRARRLDEFDDLYLNKTLVAAMANARRE